MGEQNPNNLIRAIFLFEINRVYTEKKDEIVLKLTGKLTGKEIIDIIVSFFLENGKDFKIKRN